MITDPRLTPYLTQSPFPFPFRAYVFGCHVLLSSSLSVLYSYSYSHSYRQQAINHLFAFPTRISISHISVDCTVLTASHRSEDGGSPQLGFDRPCEQAVNVRGRVSRVCDLRRVR